jgi:diguanylate cyclase (GGDEF)-like protein/PAS domain S-box-containing protein
MSFSDATELANPPGRRFGLTWSRRSVRDAAVIALLAPLALIACQKLDIFNTIVRLQSIYGNWGLDDLLMIGVILAVALTAFSWRRLQDLTAEVAARRAAEAEVKSKVAQLTEAKLFLNTIVDNIPVTIFVRELPERRFVLVNREAEHLVGRCRNDILGKTPAEILPQEVARLVAEHDVVHLATEAATRFEEVSLSSPEGARVTAATGVAIRGAEGAPRYIVNVVEDVTERRRAEAKIEHLAHYDALTDLPNRAAFHARLDAAVERAARTKQSLAVICVDLDGFKEVNDVFGHAVGDALLREVASRLQAGCEGAFVARLGGDEFAIICADGTQPAAAAALADRLLRSFDGEIEIAGQSVRAGMSIGVAVYPADGTAASVLLANADAALYRAKTDERGSIRFFEPEMDKRLRERRALQHDLRSATACGQLVLFYQPQASINGAIIGFEALVRWNHPTRGTVSPAEFIPLAEQSGEIVPLGAWILREACREAASWPKPLRVAVNISPAQFRHGDLPAFVHEVLLETGLAANRLEIEITEGVLIGDFSRAIAILRRLKALGVRIAMDDFGTGYSSLSYLQAFPFDKIKIDQAFVANLERNPQSAAIIRAVIGLGRGLNVPVIAEGVETKQQLVFLKDEQCSEVQGYLIGRPAPIQRYWHLIGHEAADRIAALAS